MAAVGYSGTPLAKKLGIKPAHHVVVLDGPAEFTTWLEPLPEGVELHDTLALGNKPDIVIAFATSSAALRAAIESAAELIFPSGAIWASWPKRASKVPTDITEDTVRDIALPMGLVDNKVCAISEIWSGLRVVWRTELRSERR